MIRTYTLLHIIDLNKLPSIENIFQYKVERFHIENEICPKCRSRGHLKWHDTYERYIISYEYEEIYETKKDIKRTICTICNGTHAILPDILVPYKTYSLIFILNVLRSYFYRKKSESVTAMCKRFDISVSIFYEWKRRYLQHKQLDLGILEKYIFNKDPHLKFSLNILMSDFLQTFFKRFGFSFLQYYKPTNSGSG